MTDKPDLEIYGYDEEGKPLKRPAGLGDVLTHALEETRMEDRLRKQRARDARYRASGQVRICS